VAFAPFDPFVSIETTGAFALGGLDRLTVQDDHRRAEQAAAAQARLFLKRPLQFGQNARIFPGTKVLVNGARTLHPKSTGLADEGELGFMKSVEAQFEKIVVA
jgi:hypothetical protein